MRHTSAARNDENDPLTRALPAVFHADAAVVGGYEHQPLFVRVVPPVMNRRQHRAYFCINLAEGGDILRDAGAISEFMARVIDIIKVQEQYICFSPSGAIPRIPGNLSPGRGVILA